MLLSRSKITIFILTIVLVVGVSNICLASPLKIVQNGTEYGGFNSSNGDYTIYFTYSSVGIGVKITNTGTSITPIRFNSDDACMVENLTGRASNMKDIDGFSYRNIPAGGTAIIILKPVNYVSPPTWEPGVIFAFSMTIKGETIWTKLTLKP